MVGHPLGENAPPRLDDAGDALRHQGNVLDEHAGVDGEVVDTLLGLLLDDFEIEVDVEIFEALDAVQRLIERPRCRWVRASGAGWPRESSEYLRL